MTGHEKELLARAMKACGPNGLDVRQRGRSDAPKPWRAARWVDEHSTNQFSHVGWGPTLADALTALLADLGEEVPERPSAANVGYLRMRLAEEVQRQAAGEDIRDVRAVESLLAASDRPTVLALLEGGEA